MEKTNKAKKPSWFKELKAEFNKNYLARRKQQLQNRQQL